MLGVLIQATDCEIGESLGQPPMEDLFLKVGPGLYKVFRAAYPTSSLRGSKKFDKEKADHVPCS